MKFIHMADVHLGCVPDGRAEWAQERKRELWETFRASIEDASRQKADLVLIAGDLFHHTPDVQQLREVNYLLGSYPEICFAVIAGNHDCCSPGSAWETFDFARNIAFLGSRGVECIRFGGKKKTDSLSGRRGVSGGIRSGGGGIRTGDRSDAVLWLGAFLLSALCAVRMLLFKKRGEKV